MKVSHEVPYILLEQSLSFNDYDYSLAHMLDENKDYYEFYKKQSSLGREQILDNSAYELGDSFDIQKFAEFVVDIAPTYYIIPDRIADFEATINYCENFIKDYGDFIPGKSMGVVQGVNVKEFMECFIYMNNKCDKVAIPFHSPTYLTLPHTEGKRKDERMMIGRQMMITHLMNQSSIVKKPIHLLGCSLPQEFYYYKSFPIVESIDTSNPIIKGIQKEAYNIVDGKVKESEKPQLMIDYYKEDLDEEQYVHILNNINTFKTIIS